MSSIRKTPFGPLKFKAAPLAIAVRTEGKTAIVALPLESDETADVTWKKVRLPFAAPISNQSPALNTLAVLAVQPVVGIVDPLEIVLKTVGVSDVETSLVDVSDR